MRYDAIVVGCGAAGVAALSRLTRAGLRALGLEAQDRIGGRVHTVDMGGAVELGAEWIHGETGNTVYSLARASGLPLTMDAIELDVRRSDGTRADRDLCDELMAFCLSCKDDAEPSERPVGEYVTERFYDYIKGRPISRDVDFCTQFLRLVSLVYSNYDATRDWNDMSLRGSAQYRELPGHLHWSFGALGYDSVFTLLMGDAKPEVRLNSEVTSVLYDASGARVRCADGALYVADSVIVTVSLGVLKERHESMFRPPLPRRKVDAIEAISMGVMDKICMRYSEAWWPRERKFCGFLWRGAELAEAEEWMTRVLGFSVPTGAKNVITLWTSGESAVEVERMPEERVLRGCKRLLQMFMGESVVVPDPVAIVRSTWYSNPYTRGSYTYRGLAADGAPSACADLAEPLRDNNGVQRVLFAGEACSQHHYSTVHGAIETGVTAAEAVIARAGKLRSKI